MISDPDNFSSLAVTIMGLGLHGGGVAAARFFAGRGARVTVTDLRSEEVLSPSIEALGDLPIRFVLGKHTEDIFRNADMVIKNPAVPSTSPYLKMARRVETDISVFLRLSSSPVMAVTGSKGKSTTVSAMYHCLRTHRPGCRLGGNITVSPLTFLDGEGLKPDDPVILELSSWQLADLRDTGLLKPTVAVLNIILPDHQDRYHDMDAYVADKRVIYQAQDRGDYTLCLRDDPYGRSFYEETPGTPLYYSAEALPENTPGAFLAPDGRGFINLQGSPEEILPAEVLLPGRHNRLNLLAAGAACVLSGVAPADAAEALSRFPGIEHRLEFVARRRGVDYYNDSAATIPEAVAAAVEGFERPVVLIAGGTDKELDFAPLAAAAGQPKRLVLLKGTGTNKLLPKLREKGIAWTGPFGSLKEALDDAATVAAPGDIVLLSPGCTSFGMFLNEFDRGRQYKALVKDLPG